MGTLKKSDQNEETINEIIRSYLGLGYYMVLLEPKGVHLSTDKNKRNGRNEEKLQISDGYRIRD